jgi:HSP20 family protein
MFGSPYRRNIPTGLSNYFDDVERAVVGGVSSLGFGTFRTDIMDKGDKYLLQAELPGVKKEDIQIDIDGNDLIVSVSREERKEEKQENFLRRERISGSYCRRFDVSNVDVDNIAASYKDGVLELSLPKKAQDAPGGRKINIE